MDDYRGLRQAAKKTDRDRKRSQRVSGLIANLFLGLAALVFVVGLALVGAIFYGVQAGLDLPFDDLGLLGDVAASVLSPTELSLDQMEAIVAATLAVEGQSDPRPTVGLPSPIPSATPSVTPTASSTSTPTITPTASPTRTASPTPSHTPIPSETPIPTETPFGYQPPTATFTASPPPTSTSDPDCDLSGNSSFESALLGLINDERDAQGLPTYDQDNRLREAARAHSTDMACNGIFSHTGSDGSTPGERATAQGYEWTQIGENIYGAGETSEAVAQLAFDFWMASPSQRSNLLSETFTEIGIGYIYEPSSPYGGYFTVVFADP